MTVRAFSKMPEPPVGDPRARRREGTLKAWNDERGFGFIEPALGGPEVFVHVKAFVARSGRPTVGQRLSFEIETSAPGKKRALRVRPLALPRVVACRRKASAASWGGASYFAIPAFALVYLLTAIVWRVPCWVGTLYLAASALTFLAYGIDKSAARAGRWRVSEATLHTLTLAGGWPGAIVAQQLLRHKSTKASFRYAFWRGVLINIVGFVALASPLPASIFR